jgi:hypothetical protein
MIRARAERPGVSFCRHLSAFAAVPGVLAAAESQVRTGLGAGGSEIRTLGPSRKEKIRKAERTKPA